MDVQYNSRRLYAGIRLHYRLWLRAPISASCAISAVAELLDLAAKLAVVLMYLKEVSECRCVN